eukprot:9466784-Pyramimonas_sp.AAC.1
MAVTRSKRACCSNSFAFSRKRWDFCSLVSLARGAMPCSPRPRDLETSRQTRNALSVPKQLRDNWTDSDDADANRAGDSKDISLQVDPFSTQNIHRIPSRERRRKGETEDTETG